MSIKMYATTVDPSAVSSLNIEGKEILPTLGPGEDAIAVQLEELFTAVTEDISGSLQVESQLTLEITGSLSLKAQGGIKYLFFNVGAEVGTTGTMKVSLSTTLKPKPKTEIKD